MSQDRLYGKIGANIGRVSDFPIHDRTACDTALIGRHRERTSGRLQFLLIPTVMSRKVDQRTIEAEDTTTDCTAEGRRSSGDGIEGRLQICR